MSSLAHQYLGVQKSLPIGRLVNIRTASIFIAEGKKSLERSRYRWENNIKINPIEIKWDFVSMSSGVN